MSYNNNHRARATDFRRDSGARVSTQCAVAECRVVDLSFPVGVARPSSTGDRAKLLMPIRSPLEMPFSSMSCRHNRPRPVQGDLDSRIYSGAERTRRRRCYNEENEQNLCVVQFNDTRYLFFRHVSASTGPKNYRPYRFSAQNRIETQNINNSPDDATSGVYLYRSVQYIRSLVLTVR